eukprot:3864302-Amphidinium_carterae.1
MTTHGYKQSTLMISWGVFLESRKDDRFRLAKLKDRDRFEIRGLADPFHRSCVEVENPDPLLDVVQQYPEEAAWFIKAMSSRSSWKFPCCEAMEIDTSIIYSRNNKVTEIGASCISRTASVSNHRCAFFGKLRCSYA